MLCGYLKEAYSGSRQQKFKCPEIGECLECLLKKKKTKKTRSSEARKAQAKAGVLEINIGREIMDQTMKDISFQNMSLLSLKCLAGYYFLSLSLAFCLCFCTILLYRSIQFLSSWSYHFIACLWLQGFHSKNIKHFFLFFYYFHVSTILYLNFCNIWDIFWHTK